MDSFWSFVNTPVYSGGPTPLVVGIVVVILGYAFAHVTTPERKRDRFLKRTISYTFIVALVTTALFYLYYIRRRMRYIEGFKYHNIPDEKDYRPFASVWSVEDKQKARHLLSLVWTDKETDGEVLDKESLLGWARHDRQIIPWDDNIVVASRKPHALLKRMSVSPDTYVENNRVYFRDDIANGKKWPYIQITQRNDDETDQEVMFENVRCRVPKCWRKILADKYGSNWNDTVETPRYCARAHYATNPSKIRKANAIPVLAMYS